VGIGSFGSCLRMRLVVCHCTVQRVTALVTTAGARRGGGAGGRYRLTRDLHGLQDAPMTRMGEATVWGTGGRGGHAARRQAVNSNVT
jgi:hypothetical protein